MYIYIKTQRLTNFRILLILRIHRHDKVLNEYENSSNKRCVFCLFLLRNTYTHWFLVCIYIYIYIYNIYIYMYVCIYIYLLYLNSHEKLLHPFLRV